MGDPTDEVRAAAEAALPPMEGELVAPGLHEPVEVLRDRWGVPYITAASLEDLWFAQGFVTASERLFQIDLALRVANGRLSELFAELTLDQDRFARTVGFHRLGAKEAERWSTDSRAMMDRFVEGVRAWTNVMPAPPVEYALLAVAPEVPTELGAWAALFAFLAWGLSGNWDMELLRAHLVERIGPDAARALLPPLPSDPPRIAAGGLAGRLLEALPRVKGQGSNNWVLDGSRTKSGKPLLASDPHLLVQQPGVWFEVHLRAPGYEARGVAFPFAPGVVIGTTPHHAWGITNVSGDVQDLYLERLSEDGSAVELDGAWEALRVHREEIAVRGGDPVALEVRESRHGPLLEEFPVGLAGDRFERIEEPIALRWTAADGLLEPWSLVQIARAGDFDAFREALRGLSCPGQNVVYADVDGTIGYQCTGLYPIRRSGDGTMPVPGWTSDHGWDGFVPFEDLPWSRDPERGFIATANNRIHDESYPHLIGHDFHTPFRARRIVELLEEGTEVPLEVDDLIRMQADVHSLSALTLIPRLLAITPENDERRWALDQLRTWDGAMEAASTPSAVFNTWVRAIARLLLGADGDPTTFERYYAWREPFVCLALVELLDEEPLPSWARSGSSWEALLGEGLDLALAELAERLGPERSNWRWGALHRVRFAHVLARMPGLAPMFVAGEAELGGDEQTVLQGGFDARDGYEAVVIPSWRVVVDLADLDRSMAVLSTGQSGNPTSPHWNDQFPLWASGRLREMPVTRTAVEATARRTLVLRPG